ncbi:MAG: deoxycytidylate deaminase [Alphaproteobacteria bacterium]|jgi:cytidine deaminase|nr:deoxycytidylate deaminase [Alphaproteobacteria bacterium]
MSTFIDYVPFPEIVFGLVAPVGVDRDLYLDVLGSELQRVDYNCIHIKVSQLIDRVKLNQVIDDSSLHLRIDTAMTAGDEFRSRTNRDDAFAILAALAVRRHRDYATGSAQRPRQKTAYILDQLKRPEEIASLRRIYGDNFVQISIYSPEDIRENALTERFLNSSAGAMSERDARHEAIRIMSRDEEESGVKHGQRLRDTFHLAHVIIDGTSPSSMKVTTRRFINSFFGEPFITPSRDEYFMSIARNVSRRSADLSRQVGAAIVRASGEIASIGCNEVPKATGGTYWAGDEGDARDFTLRFDPNALEKQRVLRDILRRIHSYLSDKEYDVMELRSFINDVSDNDRALLDDSLMMDIIEFGRIIHAEMSAISDAARLGISINGGTLYSTTFPCHMCARHIIAAGISEVVYLEPYVKSLTSRLYRDSVDLSGKRSDPNKVKFRSFIGIAPPLYDRVFSKGKRKENDGSAKKWLPHESKPIIETPKPITYIGVEAAATTRFVAHLIDIGLVDSSHSLDPDSHRRAKGKKNRPRYTLGGFTRSIRNIKVR